MLFSLAMIVLAGLTGGALFYRLKLPSLLGMMMAGILIGPSCLRLLDEQTLAISGTLRKIALLIILVRAGFNLKIEDLKKAGRPALLLCFVPATFEIAAFLIFAPILLGFDLLEAAILGTVMAAVSPAVVVPGMLKVMSEGYGKDKAIPQMVLAGASADDIYVLVLFSMLTSMAGQSSFHAETLLRIPTAILLGITVGVFCGLGLSALYSRQSIITNTDVQVLILLSLGMLFYALEDVMKGPVVFSGLVAVMGSAMVVAGKEPQISARLNTGFTHLWKGGELFSSCLLGLLSIFPMLFNLFRRICCLSSSV